MLKTADGTEIDRRSPSNSLTFAPVLLDGSGHKGKLVYLEAVDDADQDGFSMFCIDDVRTVSLPPGQARPLDPLPAFDERKSHQAGERPLPRRGEPGQRRDHADLRQGRQTGTDPRAASGRQLQVHAAAARQGAVGDDRGELYSRQGPAAVLVRSCRGKSSRSRWRGPLRSRTGEEFDVAATHGDRVGGRGDPLHAARSRTGRRTKSARCSSRSSAA